ncbi:hypothetical protein [Holdemania massiliensis]|uniref:Uncharacterized protein n=1 Tax=Holdemania massiliensis TaxID=1468449 RepID=A0A6N7S2M6_9FIRM|nr:hypothetical protein [Holdemania massiliensis]MSA70326.1 hypothetical protein [Holdemania massiliensis]MSA88143.1 hypothetical protein [Holdemania massiliensis]MSB76972.1 hypothetical protein [Holdemania massiliensis]MSC31898.1 hypothetical protein [Holdemania massiliensis]MSC38218.1 hypothetical protein [Holdemania massiliensis]
MAFLLLGLGLTLVILSKILYNKRCIAGQGIPYNQKEKLLLYSGYGLLGLAFVLAVFNLA